MIKARILVALAALALCLFAEPAAAQQAGPSAAPTTTVERTTLAPIGSATTPVAFDPHKATDAYLARVSGEARARSDAYFEGGYWLLLVDAIYISLVMGLFLWFRVSASIRDFAERQTRSRFWQVPLYVGPFILITFAALFPLTFYEDFFREQHYGLMNLSFWGWLAEQGMSLGLILVAGLVMIPVGYALIRAAPRTWWLWGTGLAVAFAAFVMIVNPVFVAPLFNDYSPLPESPLKEAVLSMARANGIPADNVYVSDASRQSDRISANVSGFMGTTRITLNDNLLKKGTKEETLAVLGHEMGHYVLDHSVRLLTFTALTFLAAFAFAAWGFRILTALFGGNWDVRTVDDPAGLPLLVILFVVFDLLTTPLGNTLIRTTEIQADMYGVNAIRQPDAFSTVVLKLSTYRKLDPSPFEEFMFYDHPSGRTRIWEMMRWKAEHLNDPDIEAGPVSPQ